MHLFPDYPVARFWLSNALVGVHRYAEALEEAEKAVDLDKSRNTRIALNLAWTYALAGTPQEARKIVEEILSEAGKAYFSPSQVGLVELALGQKDEGYKWLEKAYDEHDGFLMYFASLPWLEQYRSDLRWLEIERKIDLTKQQ